MDKYRNGRESVINEIDRFIKNELDKISKLRKQIPKDTTDLGLCFKRATLTGAARELYKIDDLLIKKELNMRKKKIMN